MESKFIVYDTHRLISIFFAQSGVFSSIDTVQFPFMDLFMDNGFTGVLW